MNLFAPTAKKILVVQTLCLFISVFSIFYINWFYFLLSLIFFFLYTILGVALSFHRMLSHRHYKFNSILEKILILFGTLSNVGSPVTWVAIHREHHKFCDTSRDPHSPLYKNIQFVLFFSMFSRVNLRLVRDLLKNKFCILLHQYYYLIQIPWIILLFLLGGINLVIYCHVFPSSVTWVLGSLLNYVNHKFGYTNFNVKNNSKNNTFTGILLLGEGWHNNHHAMPNQPNLRIKKYEFDLIHLISIHLLKGKTP
jgi:stearoyl-CoA desaturase (delta-9 desaturase)